MQCFGSITIMKTIALLSVRLPVRLALLRKKGTLRMT